MHLQPPRVPAAQARLGGVVSDLNLTLTHRWSVVSMAGAVLVEAWCEDPGWGPSCSTGLGPFTRQLSRDPTVSRRLLSPSWASQ